MLLEREDPLAELQAHAEAARSGGGRVVFLVAEAGGGKSSLVREFLAALRNADVLLGACDPLMTSRVLDPLIDFAEQAGGGLEARLSLSDTAAGMFDAFLDHLRSAPRLTVAVVEDIHWADTATLDLLRFLARRAARLSALVVATYRDDEIGPAHPVRVMLGDVVSFPSVHRVALEPLSLDAVRALAEGTGVDAAALRARTGGNPFFVTEVLASCTDGIPPSARDAVLSRAARLSRSSREALEVAAVLGQRAEVEILATIASAEAVDECVETGLLRPADDAIAFRHEIARLAVESSIGPARRAALHAAVLAQLEGHGGDIERLAHHALGAGDRTATHRYSIASAERAARLGAHRQAAAHYRRAVEFADALDDAALATLLESWSVEAGIADEIDEAVEAGTRALALRRALGDRLREGDGLRWVSRLHWMSDRADECERDGRLAIELLEPLGATTELARAHANLAQFLTTCGRVDEGIRVGQQALELARLLDLTDVEVHAAISVGLGRLLRQDESGRTVIEAAVERASAIGADEQAARGLFQLARVDVAWHRFVQADGYLGSGLRLCEERDVEFWRAYLLTWSGRMSADTGRWDEAIAVLRRQSAQFGPRTAMPRRLMALTTLGKVLVRRGDPEGAAMIDDVVTQSMSSPDPLFALQALCARSESAWLAGDLDRARVDADAAWRIASGTHSGWSYVDSYPWLDGEAAYRLWKSGGPVQDAPIAEPYRMQLEGRWREAAAAWAQVGCPYEHALALAEGDESAQREALVILDDLRAAPAAAIVRRRLRASGVRDLPRAPRATARRNSAGLTPRELEVLELLAGGLRDAEIGARLVISERTVNHHVASILRKLGVGSRTAAATEAHRLGIHAR